MKIIRFIMNVLSLISAIVCLYTVISIAFDIEPTVEIIENIMLYNLFACPILTIITSTLNLNKEDKKNE